MTVMTLNLVEKQPAAMRRIIGKHLAVPRWQDTCDYYNQMMERTANSLLSCAVKTTSRNDAF